ncbi:hypothetical protein GCM10010440_47760 [Kitasatospora cinereorecta]
MVLGFVVATERPAGAVLPEWLAPVAGLVVEPPALAVPEVCALGEVLAEPDAEALADAPGRALADGPGWFTSAPGVGCGGTRRAGALDWRPTTLAPIAPARTVLATPRVHPKPRSRRPRAPV